MGPKTADAEPVDADLRAMFRQMAAGMNSLNTNVATLANQHNASQCDSRYAVMAIGRVKATPRAPPDAAECLLPFGRHARLGLPGHWKHQAVSVLITTSALGTWNFPLLN